MPRPGRQPAPPPRQHAPPAPTAPPAPAPAPAPTPTPRPVEQPGVPYTDGPDEVCDTNGVRLAEALVEKMQGGASFLDALRDWLCEPADSAPQRHGEPRQQ